MAEMDAAQVREVYKAGYEDGMYHISRLLTKGYLTPRQVIDYIHEKTKTGQYAQKED